MMKLDLGEPVDLTRGGDLWTSLGGSLRDSLWVSLRDSLVEDRR